MLFKGKKLKELSELIAYAINSVYANFDNALEKLFDTSEELNFKSIMDSEDYLALVKSYRERLCDEVGSLICQKYSSKWDSFKWSRNVLEPAIALGIDSEDASELIRETGYSAAVVCMIAFYYLYGTHISYGEARPLNEYEMDVINYEIMELINRRDDIQKQLEE